MTEGQAPPELRLLWPEVDTETADQPIDNETAVLAERRAKVFRLYTRGLTIRDIADHDTVRCSKSTVGRDVQHVLASYRLIAMQDAAAHVAAQLARLAHIESEALEAWERSKAVAEETETEESGRQDNRLTRLKNRRRQRDGNPQFLQVARECWLDRCKLLRLVGQDAPSVDTKSTAPLVIERGPLHIPPPDDLEAPPDAPA